MKHLYLSAIAILFLQAVVFAQAETQNPNSASGLYWRVKGNAGTDTAQNFLGTTDANYLTFRTNNIRRMTIDTGGRVGIGTTQPNLSGMLEITNTINTNPGVIISHYGSPNELWFRRAQGTISAPAIVGTNGSLGRIDGRGYDGSTYLQATRIEMLVDSASASGLMTGRLAFLTAPAGSAPIERMRINRNGLVGINTTAPLTRLDINGDIALRQAALTLANGANHNVVINPHPSGYSYYRITGPTAAFNITGFTAAGATDGRVLIIQNATTQILTLTDQSTLSTTSNRIMTGGGTLIVGDSGTVTLIYSVGDNRWQVQAYSNAVLSGGTFANTSWNTVGNAGLSNAVNFLGTTDNADVIIKRQNEEAFRAYPGGALVGVGNTSTGVVPVSGFGTRLMWAPAKNAFRAGNVNGVQWDDANVGIGSAAFGANNTASGNNTFAAGNGNTVSGQNSLVIGNNNTVTATHALVSGNSNNAAGNFSVVFNNTASSTAAATTSVAGGFQSQTQANLSIAIGWADTAKGVASVALGGFSNEARSDYSFAAGNNNLASANQAAAFGNNNTASGVNSFVSGVSNTASGAQSVAFGDGNNVSGFNSLVTGNTNTVSSTRSIVSGINNNVAGENNLVTGVLNTVTAPFGHSIVVGFQNTLSGSASAAIGFLSNANAFTTFAAGDRVTANGQASAAFGYQSVAQGTGSWVAGQQDTAVGNISYAFGQGNRAASYGEMVVGVYGTQYTAASTTAHNAADRIFNVGIGTGSAARADAFTILKGGNVRVVGLATGGTFITAPSATTDKLVFADASGDLRAIANGSSGQVLTINGSGIPQWSTSSANAWNLTGNAGTVDGTNFIGTTDDVPFNLKVNNQKAGRIDSAQANVFLGYKAGNVNSTGYSNVFVGYNAGLNNTTGRQNTFVGDSAGRANTTGVSNAFFGMDAGFSNSTGSANAFFGQNAGNSNTTGSENSFFGEDAGFTTTSGNFNSFFGENTGFSNTTGSENSFFGEDAGISNTTGHSNSFFGEDAGRANTTGGYNTMLGDSANLSAVNLTNATAVGAKALVGASNSMVLGSIQGLNGATNTVRVGIGTTTPARALHIGNDTLGVRYEGVSTGGSFITTPSATTDKIMYADANGDLRAMTSGSTGDVLTYTASGPAWSATTGSAWNLTGNTPLLADFFGTTNASDIRFRTNNTQRMVLTSAGRLGINTATPAYPIDLVYAGADDRGLSVNMSSTVAGASGIVSEMVYNGASIGNGIFSLAENSGTGNVAAVYAQADNSANANLSVSVKAFNTAEANFNLGVQADAVGTNVNVGGQNIGVSASASGAATNYGIQASASTGSTYWAGYFGEIANGDGKVYIKDTLAINTTSPQRRFHLSGTTSGMRYGGVSTGGTFITAPSATTDKIMYADANGDLRAMSAGSTGQVLTYTASGPAWGAATDNTDWNLTGNSGTVDGTNFIGTTDNIPFTIRTNNQQSGRVDPLLSNAFLGYWAGRDFSTGTQNTAIGTNALLLNTTGARNTAIGTSALENTNGGSGNTAVGYAALQSNTTASNSTAVGFEALMSNTTATGNTAFGARALRSVVASPGNANTALGRDALMTLTTGTDNVAIGNLAMTAANSNYNVAVGGQAMENQLTGNWNVAVGFAALNSATSSVNNTALGSHALYNNLTGTRLVSVGSFSLFNNTASHNIAVGDSAMLLNTSGTSNVTIGNSVLRNNVTSGFNVAVGREALYNAVSGSNTAVGYRAGYGNTTGTRNSLFGDSADVTATNLTNATAIGWNARVAQSNSMVLGSIQGLNGATNTVRVGIGTNTPARALHIGNDTLGVRHEGVSTGGSFITTPSATTDKIMYADANGDLRAMTSGSTGDVLTYTASGPAWSAATGSAWNLTGNSGTVDGTNFIGTIDSVPFNIRVNNQRAGKIDLIRHSVIFGHMAGNANTTAQLNVLVGDSAGFSMTTGFRNTLIGNRAGRSVVDGIQNTFVGNHAGVNTTGSNNTFVGSRAGFNTTTAGANTFMGESSGANNTTGAANSFYGQASGANNTTGSSNTFMGRDAGAFTNTGSANAFVGFEAGRNNTTGESNAFFGENAGRINTTGSYNTALGDSASVGAVNLTNATAVGAKAVVGISNALVLGSINGVNSATASVNVGIGTTSPSTKLTITDPDNVNVTLRVASVSTAYEPALELMRTGAGGEWKIRTNSTGQMTFSRSPDDFVTNVDYYEMAANSFRPAIDDNNSLGEAASRWTTVFATNGTINTSDFRDKENVLPLHYGINEVMKLRPVTFNWKENPQWGKKIGFIAQDVQPILSEVVQVGNLNSKTPVLDDNGNPVPSSDKLGIYYSDIIPVTVKAIQEQQQMIEIVKKENADLKIQLEMLKQRMNQLEKK